MVTVIAIHLKPTVSDTEPQASSLCAVGCSGSPGECLGVGRVGILAALLFVGHMQILPAQTIAFMYTGS